MKEEVGIIKHHLKTLFPDNSIQVSYIKGKGVLSVDGLLIKTNIPFEEIQNELLIFTKYISIIRHNEIYMENGCTVNPQITGCEYTDIEYIKIKEI